MNRDRLPQLAEASDHLVGSNRVDESAIDVRDYELLALVEQHDVSVRLRNSIFVATHADTLPLRTVGAYLHAGAEAQRIMMGGIRNFGRKTASELDALVHAVSVAGIAAPRVPSPSEAAINRAELLELFEDETVAEAMRGELFSARLVSALNEAALSSMPFADVIDNFQATIGKMLRVPNCGRKSVSEFRAFCDRYIASRLHKAGYADTAPLAAWLLGGPEPMHRVAVGKPGFGNGTAVEAAAPLPDQFATPEHDRLVDRLEWLLAELDPRAQMILRRRNGIGQNTCETLEEIGSDELVTRERIRQIEAKSLKRIRIRVLRAPIAELLNREGRAAWRSLVGDETFLRRENVHDRRKGLDPYIRLTLDILGLNVSAWLDQVAHPMPHGWLSPDADASAVEAASELLTEAVNGPLPKPFVLLVEADAVPSAKAAAILIHNQPVLYDYLMPSRVGVRLTRLVRLHALLASEELYFLERLVQRYRAMFEDDPCSERDAEIVMDAAPHLFLEIEDGCWSAIGTGGASLPEAIAIEAPTPNRAEDPGTIAQALQTTLRRRGPTRLVELMDDALEILPDGRSANSIGPILLTRRDLFVRALPGVYALPEQIQSYLENMPPEWPVLFNDAQARHYAVARYAGEPRNIFPFWTQAIEYSLCVWARHSGDDTILASLLAIATIDEWQINEHERQEWLRLQKLKGRYDLGNSLRHGAAYELPDLDRVFAACHYAVKTGQFNWVAGNRLTGRGIGWHGGAGLVAILLRLGAIEEVGREGYRWQRPHRTTPLAADLCHRLDAAFARLGADANWTSAIGQELAERAITDGGDDWVEDAALAGMFSSSYVRESMDADDDDPLAELVAAQRRARGAEHRGATLDWLLEE